MQQEHLFTEAMFVNTRRRDGRIFWKCGKSRSCSGSITTLDDRTVSQREMTTNMLQTYFFVTVLVYLNTYLAGQHTQTFEFFVIFFVVVSIFPFKKIQITFTKQNYVLINANVSRQTCTTQLMLVGKSGVGECGTIL